MRLTNYWIKKKVQSLASGAASRKHEYRALEDAARILVLYEMGDHEIVAPCLDKLRKMGKQVQACVFVPGENVPELGPADLAVHARKELDAWSTPSDRVVEQFKALKADILIDLTHSDCYPMQFLMLQHPCGFKVGGKKSEMDLYDLSISVTERDDLKHLFEHILFYLQAIHSK